MKICAGFWIYCAVLVTPPWLFGWSSYQLEGLLVTCSWDYTSRNLSNRHYYVFLLVLGFVVPVAVFIFCYSAILGFILWSSRDITRLMTTSDGRVHFRNTAMSFLQRRKQKDVRTALIILYLALLYITAWTPYTIVSLIGQFGPVDDDGQMRLSPLTVSIPAFFAKTVIALNPLIYGFAHPQFCLCVHRLLQNMGISNKRGTRDTTFGILIIPILTKHQSPPASPDAVPSSSVDSERDPSNVNNESSASPVHPQFVLNGLDVIGNHHVLLRKGILITYNL